MCPFSLSCATTALAVSAGMSKPMARRREDGRVDANHVAVEVEGRSARVPLVDGRVDLNKVVIRSRADVAPAGRYDAGRDGAAEAEWITDRDHPIANPRRMIGEFHIGEVAAVNLDESEVGLLIAA